MSPLHVGLITPSYAGVTGPGSGIGVHFRHLAEGLLAAGHRVTAVVPLEAGRAAADIPAHLVPAPARRPRLLGTVGRLHWQLNQWLWERERQRAAARAATTVPGVDVWETTSTDAPALRFLELTGRGPLVARVSTTATQLRETNGGAPNWIGRVHEKWERRLVRGADAVVTHSEGHRTRIGREFDLDPAAIPVIPHGIPLPAITTRRAENGTVRLLYVGRLETRKGADLLLAALDLALADRPGASAVLVGSDSGDAWRSRWRNDTPPGLRERVVFAGAVDDDTLAAHYRAADLFVAPSRYESFGLMFAEAMAWGLPVVALRAPGALDLVVDGETGLLTPPEDVPALAAALTRLLDDPALRLRLGAAARERAVARYSREEMIRASVELYRRLARPLAR